MPSLKLRNRFIWLMLAFGVIGFADSIYLTAKHYSGGVVPCALTGGCETVLTSAYSIFWGLPLSLWGVFFYITALVLIVLYYEKEKKLYLRLVWGLTSLSFLVSLVLLGLQLFVLKAICLYCMVSLGSSFVLCFSSTALWLLQAKLNKLSN